MNKKSIIQTVIIAACFLASGIVLYKGFFGGPSAGPAITPGVLPGTNTKTITTNVLPYGTSMDFKSVLSKQNLHYGQIDYPKVDPNSEIGIDQSQLVLPLQEAKP